MATSSASNPLRVRLDGPLDLHVAAAWALEALLARAAIHAWEIVEPGAPADLIWGSSALPADPGAWQFGDAEAPDPERDPLACTFWWLARVEEVDAPPSAFDEHGRFRYAASAAARGDGPLAVPVDELALELGRTLEPWRDVDPAATPPWHLVATHDIDVPWRWTRVGTRRALRALREAARRRRGREAVRLLAALTAAPAWMLLRRDPWCNARAIARVEQRLGARSTSYVIVDHHGPQDGDAAALKRGTTRFVEAMVRTAGERSVGLHLTYGADADERRIDGEIARLEPMLGVRGLDHRFHYLRHRPPLAWPRLARCGIVSDSSLGYAEQPGFRAGTAHPYRAWDHDAGEPLDLVVIPLAAMDASYDERYLDIRDPQLRDEHLAQVLDVVARVGGCASLLVHNDRLCTVTDDGWTRSYRRILQRLVRSGASACTAADARDRYLARIPASRRAAATRPAGV